MEILIFNFILILIVGIILSFYFLVYRPMQKLLKRSNELDKTIKDFSRIHSLHAAEINKLKKRIDDIFVVTPDARAPNEATKTNDDYVEMTEENPLDLPTDVKLQVEGGDQVPPGVDNG